MKNNRKIAAIAFCMVIAATLLFSVTAFAMSGMDLEQACLKAAQAARFVGEAGQPTPAISIAELMTFVGQGVKKA